MQNALMIINELNDCDWPIDQKSCRLSSFSMLFTMAKAREQEKV